MGADFHLNQSLAAIGAELLLAFVVLQEIGYRLGLKHSHADRDHQRERIAGTIAGTMLALLGFMLAIALSMADTQFQARRRMVLDEANAIGTSRLRATASGGPHGAAIVRLFRDYTQRRVEFFAAGEDAVRLEESDQQTARLQQQIWEHATAIATAAPNPVSAILLDSLNQTFDIATARRWALEVRVPPYVINFLLVLSFFTMALLGYYIGVGGVRYPVLTALLLVAFTLAMLLVMDLNRPRGGFIRAEQEPLLWMLEDMRREAQAEPPPS